MSTTPNDPNPYVATRAIPDELPKSRVIIALVSIHFSVFLYVLVGVGCLALFGLLAVQDASSEEEVVFLRMMGVAALVMCLAVALAIEAVAIGMHYRKYWAWIGGIVIFAMYLPSAFFPLGALGMWGLLAEGSRAEFEKVGKGPTPRWDPVPPKRS